VMAERHALPRGDGRHALQRDGERQQHDSTNSEERSRHRWALYASCFERDQLRGSP
jgi:hypothetical protein